MVGVDVCLGERMYSVELEAGEAAPRLTPGGGQRLGHLFSAAEFLPFL